MADNITTRFYCDACDTVTPVEACPIDLQKRPLCPICAELAKPFEPREPKLTAGVFEPAFMASIPTSDEERGVIRVPDYAPGFLTRRQA